MWRYSQRWSKKMSPPCQEGRFSVQQIEFLQFQAFQDIGFDYSSWQCQTYTPQWDPFHQGGKWAILNGFRWSTFSWNLFVRLVQTVLGNRWFGVSTFSFFWLALSHHKVSWNWRGSWCFTEWVVSEIWRAFNVMEQFRLGQWNKRCLHEWGCIHLLIGLDWQGYRQLRTFSLSS